MTNCSSLVVRLDALERAVKCAAESESDHSEGDEKSTATLICYLKALTGELNARLQALSKRWDEQVAQLTAENAQMLLRATEAEALCQSRSDQSS